MAWSRRFGIGVIVMMLAALTPVRAQDRIEVVASFSILGDFARAVGGARTDVTTLVGANGDVHVFTPSPAGCAESRCREARDRQRARPRRLAAAAGAGLRRHARRSWLRPQAFRCAGLLLVKRRSRSEGSADPHAWQSVANAEIYVANIRDALITADPAGDAVYRANAADYLVKLDALDREVREAVARIPPERRKVISTHNAFSYFEAAYGIAFIAPQGVSTDNEPSARDIAATVAQIRNAKIPAIFLENLSDPRLIRQIAAEAGARVGGTLYSDSLSDEKGDAPTYIDMVRHNIRALTSALAE